MLDWQVTWINDNLSKLFEKTKCDIHLLDELYHLEKITKEEIDELERLVIHDEHGGYKKVRELYSILKTREAYDDLIQVLEQNCQTDAAQILKDGRHAQDAESLKKRRRLQKYTSLPKGLEEFLLNKLHSGKICVISTLDCDVTCERIKDAGGIPVVKWEGSNFGFEITKQTTFAISHVENVEQMVSQVISDELKKSKRIIIVTKRSTQDVLKEVPKSFSITVAAEKLALSDLSEHFKKDLLTRYVLIQGRPRQLKDWIDATKVSLNDNEFGGQLLIDLINNKTPVLLKDVLPEKLHYYVGRSLRSRTMLSRDKIFQNRSNDIFVFSGLERYELSTLVSEGQERLRQRTSKTSKTPSGTDSSKNQIKEKILSVRFILLEQLLDFEDICEMTSKPVHWIRCEPNGKYCSLVKSRGSIKTLQGMVEDENKQHECSEKEFMDIISSKDLEGRSEQHECISDSPGMGKSVLLAEVGRQILEKNPTTVGIFQELPKFIKSMKKRFPNEESRCADAIIQHLLFSITTCDFSKSCLESGFKCKSLTVNLFLDAYDEVDSKDVCLCKRILRGLKDCGNIRVFITSRPHLLPELENIFEVLGWNILPFTEENQYNFLLSSWKNRPEGKKYKNVKIDDSKLEVYTSKFVTALQNQWNDKDRAIAGIPLQYHLISVIYHVDAFKSCSCSSPNYSEPLPEIGSLTNLYTRMVEKKLEIFQDKYPATSLDARKVNNWYAAQAFADLFPELNYEILLGEDDALPEEMIKIGIVEQNGAAGKMNFIHLTFAEYFIAQALFQLLTNPQQPNVSDTFKSSLGSFFETLMTLAEAKMGLLHFFRNPNCLNYKVFKSVPQFVWIEILHHLNTLLEEPNTDCVVPLKLTFVEEGLTNLSNSIVAEDLPNIFKLLQNWNCFKDIENNIFTLKYLRHAVRRSSLKMIKAVYQYKTKKEMTKMVNDTREKNTLLHSAVARGDYNIFEFILETYKDKVKTCQDSKDDVLSGLVHHCVKWSWYNSEDIIDAKKNIIKRLLELNKGLLEFSFGDRTPILSQEIHPQLIYFLVERANVFATSKTDQNTLLDNVTSCMSSKEYCHLVQILYQSGHLQKLISNSQRVELAFSMYTLSKETFTIFKRVGLNFKTMSKCVFEHASRLEKEECVEYLKSFFDVWVELEKESNPIGQSCLYITLDSLNPAIVAWLIDTKGLNVNSLDIYGYTPFHYVSRINCYSKDNKEIIKILELISLLLNKGGDPRILNSDKESVLHLAAQYSCEEIVNIFIDLVEDINGKDCKGNTALLRAVENRKSNSILNVLLNNGADPKVTNNRGENLLHLLAWNKPWVEWLVDEEGLSVDSTDNKGNTPFHFAALESDCIQVISKLVDKGGKINVVNKGGFTPFDVYLYQASPRSLEVVKYFIACDTNKKQMTTALRTLICRHFNFPIMKLDSMLPKKLSVSTHGFVISKDIVTTIGVAEELLNNGANVEELINQIFKGLETFEPDFQYKFLKLLHDHEVCSSEVNAYQGLLLMVKSHEISEDYIKLGNSLLDCLEDINKTDSEGRTLLHLACQARNLEGVKLLVKKGVKVNELDENGNTPLDIINVCPYYRKCWESEGSLLTRQKQIAEFLKSHMDNCKL